MRQSRGALAMWREIRGTEFVAPDSGVKQWHTQASPCEPRLTVHGDST